MGTRIPVGGDVEVGIASNKAFTNSGISSVVRVRGPGSRVVDIDCVLGCLSAERPSSSRPRSGFLFCPAVLRFCLVVTC